MNKLIKNCWRMVSSTKFLIVAILILNIFFRSYQAVERYGYAHDADLFSWIVKDIVDNKHLRLVGQLTSSPGIYIGPLYYYLLVPFYLVTAMDPVGAILLSIVLGVLTALSFYWVFKKLYNQTAGLIALFLQSVMLSRIGPDRWIVPTITSSIWEVWFFYCIVSILRGNFSVLPLLGLLVALIWHINFSLAPILITVPLAMLISRKLPKIRQLLNSVLVFLTASLPLLAFEFKHGFTQFKSLLDSFSVDQGGGSGLEKYHLVLQKVSANISYIFFYPKRDFNDYISLAMLLLPFVVALFLVKRKGFEKSLYLVFFVWLASMIGFFSLSTKIVSEYYFSNLNILYISSLVLLLSWMIAHSKLTRCAAYIIFLVIFVRSFTYMLYNNEHNFMGYMERKAVAQYIANDSRNKGWPCVSVSYIAKPGEDVGFRYFFYLDKLHVNQSLSGSPNYTIVVPQGMAPDNLDMSFGAIGVINPRDIDQSKVDHSCSGQDSNLTDPLFGYVE